MRVGYNTQELKHSEKTMVFPDTLCMRKMLEALMAIEESTSMEGERGGG
jgi:hypothetical protein